MLIKKLFYTGVAAFCITFSGSVFAFFEEFDIAQQTIQTHILVLQDMAINSKDESQVPILNHQVEQLQLLVAQLAGVREKLQAMQAPEPLALSGFKMVWNTILLTQEVGLLFKSLSLFSTEPIWQTLSLLFKAIQIKIFSSYAYDGLKALVTHYTPRSARWATSGCALGIMVGIVVYNVYVK